MPTEKRGNKVVTYESRYEVEGPGCAPLGWGCGGTILWTVIVVILGSIPHAGDFMNPVISVYLTLLFGSERAVNMAKANSSDNWELVAALLLWPFGIGVIYATGAALIVWVRNTFFWKEVTKVESLAEHQAQLDAKAKEERRLEEVAERKRKAERDAKEAARLAIVRQKEAEAERERQAIVRAEQAKQNRLRTIRFDNWKVDRREPHVAILPNEWAPLTMVGLAYANVVAYGSVPPEQVYNRMFGAYQTVGPQVPSERGIYLVGIITQRTLCKPLVVKPYQFPGTTSNDLVMFAIDDAGQYLYLNNPARLEERLLSVDDETNIKLKQLVPVLKGMYEKVLSSGGQGRGWA